MKSGPPQVHSEEDDCNLVARIYYLGKPIKEIYRQDVIQMLQIKTWLKGFPPYCDACSIDSKSMTLTFNTSLWEETVIDIRSGTIISKSDLILKGVLGGVVIAMLLCAGVVWYKIKRIAAR